MGKFNLVKYMWFRKAHTTYKIISGVPPLTYTAKRNGTLKNYRIYGNTENGESVGDKTGNLFDGEFQKGYWAYADGSYFYNSNWISTKKIKCEADKYYSFCFSVLSRWYGFVWYDINNNYISTNNWQNGSDVHYRSYSAVSPENAAYMIVDIAGYPSASDQISPAVVTDFMLVEGPTAQPYEPYGYRVPVTVTDGTNTETTNLYLPEQIKMVGGEAEYIDYAEQKQHFADGTSVDVNLPALPTLSGTNTLSVGTTVQPSAVEVKGEIKAIEGGGVIENE